MKNKIDKSKTEKLMTKRLLVNVALIIYFVTGECCGKLIKTPANVTVFEGERTILECETDFHDLMHTVFWKFENEDIFYGGEISLPYASKFGIQKDHTKGIYNLIIPSATKSHNGRYTCADDEGDGEKSYAWLTVTELLTTEANGNIHASTEAASTRADALTYSNIIIIVISIIAVVLVVVAVVICKRKRRSGSKHENVSYTRCERNQKENIDENKNVITANNPPVKNIIKAMNAEQNKNVITANNPPAKNIIDAINTEQNKNVITANNPPAKNIIKAKNAGNKFRQTEASAQPDQEDALEAEFSCTNQEEELQNTCTIIAESDIDGYNIKPESDDKEAEDINDKEDTASVEETGEDVI